MKAQFQEKKMLHTEEQRQGTEQISHGDNACEKPVKRSLYSSERKKKRKGQPRSLYSAKIYFKRLEKIKMKYMFSF